MFLVVAPPPAIDFDPINNTILILGGIVSCITVITTLVGVGVQIGTNKAFRKRMDDEINEIENKLIQSEGRSDLKIKEIRQDMQSIEKKIKDVEQQQGKSDLKLEKIDTTLNMFMDQSNKNWERMFNTLENRKNESHKDDLL